MSSHPLKRGKTTAPSFKILIQPFDPGLSRKRGMKLPQLRSLRNFGDRIFLLILVWGVWFLKQPGFDPNGMQAEMGAGRVYS